MGLRLLLPPAPATSLSLERLSMMLLSLPAYVALSSTVRRTMATKTMLELVDVDCNLLHKDLIAMMDLSSFVFDDVPRPLR